jgi:hypothetical protein
MMDEPNELWKGYTEHRVRKTGGSCSCCGDPLAPVIVTAAVILVTVILILAVGRNSDGMKSRSRFFVAGGATEEATRPWTAYTGTSNLGQWGSDPWAWRASAPVSCNLFPS